LLALPQRYRKPQWVAPKQGLDRDSETADE
jgi:hypothetical protein